MNYLYLFCTLLLASFAMSFNTSESSNRGVATYYSDLFQGRRTASGELYDKTKLTAAHRTLPLGTKIKITRTDNQKSVIVRINDRGPYSQSRVLDISKAAAEKIGLLRVGKATVTIEVIDKNNKVALTEENADELMAILNDWE